MEENLTGLSRQEVEERRQRGEGQSQAVGITKSRGRIVRENVLTLFNGLNFLIAGLLFAVGAYSNMLFIAIIILNILIGIAQEFKAKKLVDELSVLNRPKVFVRREGEDIQVDPEEIVKDDLILLESGRQVCNDSVVVSGNFEMNESLLTGESGGVVKAPGDGLYSGSFVITGKGLAKVTHVGNENYATGLVNQVKKEKKVQSELLGSMRKVTRFTSLLIIPLGILLFLEAFFLRNGTAQEAVASSAAGLLGMLPKGLVLLISVSLAAGVIRLAKMKILVQNIYSLETLAHVDTLCLDKTGTITDGKLKVCRKIPVGKVPRSQAEMLIQSYMAACEDNNPTFQALKKAFSAEQVYPSVHKIPFSSKRKWGAVSLKGAGTVFVGAPEKLMGEIPENLEQELVKALQRQGHKVAMTGDGVNDLLALREADCSIAVADGSDASRQLAQVVLLDSDFTHLPQVVMEGRKVINNVTRTAAVFFIKTIYSVLVSIFCLLANVPFPFIPIQITLIDACIEAYPSFITIVESDTRRIRGSFLKTALRNALPFGLTVTGMIILVSLLAPFTIPERQTVMYLALIVISMTAVIKSCVPFNLLRGFICITMVLGTFGALWILPQLFEVSSLQPEMLLFLAITILASWVLLLFLGGIISNVYGKSRKADV
ncbi:MAG: HAD-IC family P-type ATPase [Clostridiales bacterium]|nr:HAD-IC family P-type ATPase [Clostridiales bacterium]